MVILAANTISAWAISLMAAWGKHQLQFGFCVRHAQGLVGREPIICPLAVMFLKSGNNFGYCAFTAYGCFWISLALILIGNHFNIYVSSTTDIGWFLVAWTGLTAILWIGSMRISGALGLTFTLLLVGFVLLDLAHFGYPQLTVLPVGKPWI